MNTLFTGLSAFPLTPLHDDRVDEKAFIGLIKRLVSAGVDSITALGSTWSYAYLTREERARVAQLAVKHAGTTPVFIGVGALRTSEVLANIDAAEEAGAAGILLAPITYQPLTDDDVLELFRTVTAHTRLPVIVYDKPNTTHFRFSLGLYEAIGKLDGIAAIKVPGVPTDELRAVMPKYISIGVSGDAFAAEGLKAGCDTPGIRSLAARCRQPRWRLRAVIIPKRSACNRYRTCLRNLEACVPPPPSPKSWGW